MSIELETRPAPTHEDVSAAYWRGVEDGRKVDRRWAYRLGYQRGVREVFSRWDKALQKLGAA